MSKQAQTQTRTRSAHAGAVGWSFLDEALSFHGLEMAASSSRIAPLPSPQRFPRALSTCRTAATVGSELAATRTGYMLPSRSRAIAVGCVNCTVYSRSLRAEAVASHRNTNHTNAHACMYTRRHVIIHLVKTNYILDLTSPYHHRLALGQTSSDTAR